MKTVFKWLWYIVLTVWMLPQVVFGLAALLWCKVRHDAKWNGVYYAVPRVTWGFSMGWILFVGDKIRQKHISFLHEKGHQKQSKILGWLYLIVIGLPSWWNYVTCRRAKDYHKFWTERWADNIAGITWEMRWDGQMEGNLKEE